MLSASEMVLPAGNILGEGPFPLSEKLLYWFDIFGSSAYRLDIARNKIKAYKLDEFICCAGITVNNKIIAAGEKGVTLYSHQMKPSGLLFPPPFDTKKLRFNDGKVGPDGAFWAGVMSHYGDKPIGMLLRISDRIECIIEGMMIPNGIGWSPDGNTMYITDTGREQISKWDFNRDTGQISDQKLFISSTELEGSPDGLAVDAAGNIWSAFWGGSRLYGFRPSGEIFAEIIVDARNPTSCCFCGAEYSSLFITSARHGIEKAGTVDGSLFRVSTDTVGKAPYRFRY